MQQNGGYRSAADALTADARIEMLASDIGPEHTVDVDCGAISLRRLDRLRGAHGETAGLADTETHTCVTQPMRFFS